MLANGPAGSFSTSAADPTIAVMPIRTPAQPSQDENTPVRRITTDALSMTIPASAPDTTNA